jgi:ectoine hydroxylase-related dioxygenase (phytanoyl-CoA dioxygenase family)
MTDTQQLKDFYTTNGYVVIKDIIPLSDINGLLDSIKEMVRLETDIVNLDEALIFLKKENKSSWIYETINQSLSFLKFIINAPVQEVALELLGATSLGVVSPAWRFDAPGDTKNIRDWHQDSNYFLETESGDDAIVVWMPLNEAYSDNGSVILCPGSHKSGRLLSAHKKAEGLASEQFIISQEVAEKYEHITIKASAGDAVFIHMDLIHKSGINITEHVRQTVQIRFANNKVASYRPVRLIPEYPTYHNKGFASTTELTGGV